MHPPTKTGSIIFSKIKFLSRKHRGNICFLKNYGISVTISKKLDINVLTNKRIGDILIIRNTSHGGEDGSRNP